MRSIQARLNGVLALSLILVFVLLGIGMSVSFRVLAENYILARLEHDAESLLTALIVRGGDESTGLRADRLNPVYQRVYSGHYYRIEIAGQVLRSRSLWDQDLALPTVGVGAMHSLRVEGPEEQLLLVRVAGYRKAGAEVVIAVAEDLSPIRAEVRQAQLRYALFGVVALALLLLLQRALLSRGLRPLARTGDELDALEHGERRELGEAVPREMLPLVRKINRLLKTLQQRLLRSRNALGNLAHALKTPLTLLQQIADRDDSFHDRATAAQARVLIEKIRMLTERELKRARLAGAAEHGGRMRLRAELEALAGVLRQLHRERGVRIDVEVPAQLDLSADREDMHELFGNLLDNACKWARSRVRVRAGRAAGAVTITVEDDGPGRDSTELERLNRRGVRIDEDGVPGHGLGLAIVQDAVSHYGGELRLGRSPELGGFLAEVRLPAHAESSGDDRG